MERGERDLKIFNTRDTVSAIASSHVLEIVGHYLYQLPWYMSPISHHRLSFNFLSDLNFHQSVFDS